MLRATKLHIGIPLFLLVAAPWFYLVSAATDGRWLAEFIYVHHLQRYTAGAGHRQPFYYYFTTLPVDFLPWTVFALPALFTYRDYRRVLAEPTKLLLIVWFLVVFLFFSASDTKRDLYLMPLFPPVALLVAHYFGDLENGRLRQGPLYRTLPLLFFALVALVGVCGPPVAWVFRRDVFWISLPAAAGLVIGGVTTVLFILRKRPLKVFAAAMATMVATLLCAVMWIFPYIEQFKSRRFFSAEIERIVPATSQLYIYSDEMNDFNYYLGREVIAVLHSRAEVEELLAADTGAHMLIKGSDVKRLGIISPERIRITGPVGSTVWNLVALGRSDAPGEG
jgi:4-amino-4-deoxy-L-arabinose transferase-like glycosyltransferase